MSYYLTQTQTSEGVLAMGGIPLTQLAHDFGTPLYLMDEAHIRHQCQWFKTHFKHPQVETEVIYASKAFLPMAMAQLVASEGLSLDVVSGGELYTALQANYPMKNIYLHGNNKSLEELQFALDAKVGTLVLDNPYELERLMGLLKPPHHIQVLLRVNPGIEAHTHEYIATTKNNSKFGLSIFDESTMDVIKRIHEHPQLTFLGLHSHIGSQIFEAASFDQHAKAIMKYVSKIKQTLHVTVKAINLGGGFGVRYTDQDTPLEGSNYLTAMLDSIVTAAKINALEIPKVMIEPGRAIVANAGVTLYEVGNAKTTFAQKRYCFVDGSMADHLRTALYQASYHGVLANRLNDPHEHRYTVTGKACESGDIIIREVNLPHPNPGDLLAVFSTGAYHYSMASNYNRLTRPPVVFVREGEAKVVVRKETYQDLIQYDVKDAL